MKANYRVSSPDEATVVRKLCLRTGALLQLCAVNFQFDFPLGICSAAERRGARQ